MTACASFAKAALTLAASAIPAAHALLADSVATLDGDLKDVAVASVDDKAVSLSDGRKIELAKVKKVEFSAPEIPGKQTGAILKDGSVLNGVFRGKAGDATIFRSTSLGILELPAASLAGKVYDMDAFRALDLAKAPEAPCALHKDGSAVEGKILWSDEKSVGVMSSEGLAKIEASTLACVLEAPFKREAQATLRNGDVINGQIALQGESFSFKLEAGATRNLKIKALRSISFKQRTI